MCNYIDIEAIKAMIPDGWELVRVGWPKEGEKYLQTNPKKPLVATAPDFGCEGGNPRIIVKRKRWRAECGNEYYYLNNTTDACKATEEGHSIDSKRYDIGNYYQTREEAEAAKPRVRAAYRGEGE